MVLFWAPLPFQVYMESLGREAYQGFPYPSTGLHRKLKVGRAAAATAAASP